MSDVVVRPARAADVAEISRIYNHEVGASTASWDTEPEPLARREAWFAARQAAGHAVLVADRGGDILGYASYGPFREKTGYARTMEHSIYVDASARRLGIGAMLLGSIIEAARAAGVHALVGGLSDDNEVSLRLHEAFGFTTVGRLPQVGMKFGRWLDLVFVELLLDDADTP
ncbi:GNAT family N-acetyltransferase [Propioniciclava sp.]|uniref:GNAT family N-acetyltransferase n=1 Tax=Propioniciclava sp. TaxID=2038686 RepID=UPI0026215282|nr:GNAT family N-acetyltransferase [Propioniciclava sp.]